MQYCLGISGYKAQGVKEMKITIEFTPPRACFECKYVKYKNNEIKHYCLLFDEKIKDYRYGARLEICKQKELMK